MELGVFGFLWRGLILSIKVFQIARHKCKWFILGQLIFKKSSKSNQINVVMVGSISAV
jgi:hypothetical protein